MIKKIVMIWDNASRFAVDLLKFYFSLECFCTILAWGVYLGFEEEWIPSLTSHLVICLVLRYFGVKPSGPKY